MGVGGSGVSPGLGVGVGGGVGVGVGDGVGVAVGGANAGKMSPKLGMDTPQPLSISTTVTTIVRCTSGKRVAEGGIRLSLEIFTDSPLVYTRLVNYLHHSAESEKCQAVGG